MSSIQTVNKNTSPICSRYPKLSVQYRMPLKNRIGADVLDTTFNTGKGWFGWVNAKVSSHR